MGVAAPTRVFYIAEHLPVGIMVSATALAESRRGGGGRTVTSIYGQNQRRPFGLCVG